MITEELLIYLWSHQLVSPNLRTVEGENVLVLNKGQRNKDSGPDFFNAKIKIGETTWAGNIEMHVKSSDWQKHNHQNDPVYDNIILHVVFKNDKIITRKNGETIPVIELDNFFDKKIIDRYLSFIDSGKWIPCENLVGQVGHFEKMMWFDSLMTERLEQKTIKIIAEIEKTNHDLQEAFYHKLAENFGFKTNSFAFEKLAASLPLKILAKHASNQFQIEALLFGQAGMLGQVVQDDYPLSLQKEYTFLAEKYKLQPIDKKLWKLMRLRPANFPTIRISQFAYIVFQLSGNFNKILEAKKLTDVISLFQSNTNSYWDNHFQFDKKVAVRKKTLGASSINLVMINTVIPFLFIYGKTKGSHEMQERAVQWLEKIKAENNVIIRRFIALNIRPENAMQSQALLQLKNEYCDKKRCLECRIGHFLLSKENSL
ncbi:MAG TPA: DUF2851 family protein [Bacteroidales bacterium]